MSVEEGYIEASKMIPGEVVVMGPTQCHKKKVKPLINFTATTFYDYELEKFLGFAPHAIATHTGVCYETLTGEKLEKKDWLILQNGSKKEREEHFALKLKSFIERNKL